MIGFVENVCVVEVFVVVVVVVVVGIGVEVGLFVIVVEFVLGRVLRGINDWMWCEFVV